MGLVDSARAKQIQKQLDRLQSAQDAEARDRNAYKSATYQGKDPVDGTDIVAVDGVKTSGFKLMSNAPLSIGDRVNLRPLQSGLQRVDAKNVAPVLDEIVEDVANYIYITNSANVSVINTDRNRLIKDILLESTGYGIEYCPSNRKIYVGTASSVDILNPMTARIVNTITGLEGNRSLKYCPTNNKIYVGTNFGVKVIDPTTNTIVATIEPSKLFSAFGGIEYCQLNEKIYITDDLNISVIDPSTNTVTDTIEINNSGFCVDIKYCPLNETLYVCNGNSEGLSIINPSTNTVISTLGMGGSFGGIDYFPQIQKLYVSRFDNVSTINPITNTIVDLIPVTNNPFRVAYNGSNRNIYVTKFSSNNIDVINSLNTVVKTLALNNNPYQILAIN